jgi:hypothetical protein
LGQAINIRGFENFRRSTIASNTAIAKVIRQDDHDIGLGRLGSVYWQNARETQRKTDKLSKKCGFHGW